VFNFTGGTLDETRTFPKKPETDQKGTFERGNILCAKRTRRRQTKKKAKGSKGRRCATCLGGITVERKIQGWGKMKYIINGGAKGVRRRK